MPKKLLYLDTTILIIFYYGKSIGNRCRRSWIGGDHKMASLPEVFTEILLASRTKSKCDAIAARIGTNRIKTAQIDADNVPELSKLITSL